ncbi:hypothetical protein [Photobacterium halotolerans]|uniref:Uncharacterized protein n=1 Tax=Photobacterium halotolerans TaxID=265726 RepID=A0A7X4W7M9_9GAMM|nr:hypothetical protein [Photobacterium halotolerans]NAW63668.1 hypothetical protein [Photobacterium halotolerans]NAW87898.1 hypothetical protein [Photobacterium halotolerans]NAX47087.1 hypothetical protein [Photobacterium halotolerans]
MQSYVFLLPILTLLTLGALPSDNIRVAMNKNGIIRMPLCSIQLSERR